jgi:menaquinol-cytochrome c reductase iron-sulfur subunit
MDGHPTRRDALARWATWVLGSAAALLGFGPAVASIVGAAAEGRSQDGQLVPLGRLDALSAEPRQLWLRGEVRDGWMRRTEELGTVWAVREGAGARVFSSICPHLGCAVGWDGAQARFVCPCHDSVFAADGRVLSGPSPRALDQLQSRVDADGRVTCRWQRFAPAVARKRVL